MLLVQKNKLIIFLKYAHNWHVRTRLLGRLHLRTCNGVKMYDICLFGHFDTGPAVATAEVYKRVVL